MKCRYLVLGYIIIVAVSCFADIGLTVNSPGNRLTFTVFEESGKIKYTVSADNRPLIMPSVLGYEFTGSQEIEGLNRAHWNIVRSRKVISVDETWSPVFGKRSQVRNNYNETRIMLQAQHGSRMSMELVIRAYNDGLAFRHIIGTGPTDVKGKISIKKSRTQFNFAEDMPWWSYRIERVPAGPTLASELNGDSMYPLLSKTKAGLHVAVLEAHLREITPMVLASEKDLTGFTLKSPADIELPGLPFAMPWRVIMVGDTNGQLLDSDLIVNLNPKADKADFEWFKPGVSFWDWRAWGYKADDGFVYGLDLPSWKRFIDLGAETGVPYLLLDANWYGDEFSPGSDPIAGGKSKDVKEAIIYGRQKGVGLILYLNHVAAMKYGIEKIIPAYAEWGAKGIKYGFMRMSGVEKTRWTHKVAMLCAMNKLMVNFHDGPLPPTGEEAYLPNFVHREFCHAQSDAKRTSDPGDVIKILHLNMIAGPIDMNHGMFDLVDSERQRPRMFAQLNSTILAEAARTLITYGGGITVIPDAADFYRKHIELFRFISSQKMPWTESRTLSSEMGEYICMMRQTGNTYLVGTSVNESGLVVKIDLSFLPEGKAFKAAIFSDKPESHYLKNRMAYQISRRQVKKGDIITADIKPGSGHCMIIEPKKYGVLK